MRTVIATLLVACLVSPVVAQTSGEADADLVPIAKGWDAPDQEYRYGPDNLWEYINGAAELFLTYDFRQLAVRDLERGEQYATVSVYDMGHPMNAFGIFERESPTDGERLDEPGAGAVLQPPYQGLMFKDRFYVKVEVGGGDMDEATLRELLAAAAAGLPGADDPPAELALLPAANRQPGTVAYTGRDYLGLADLRNCLHADYEDPDSGQAYQIFAMRTSGDPFATISRQWHVQEKGGAVVAWREIPYQGVVVMKKTATGALGIAGCENREQAEALLARAVDH